MTAPLTTAGASAAVPGPRRLRTGIEIALVLGVSLGQSAVYSILSILDKLTQAKTLAEQTTSLNGDYTPDRPWLDLSYQIAGVVFPVLPAFLALYLLWLSHGRGGRTIGFDLRHPLRDLGLGFVIALGIGIPGLGVYLGARALGLNTTLAAGNIAAHWWTIPIYVLQAAENGILEEVVMIGYLLTRLRDARWPWWGAILFSAVIRGSYHLYQGFGGFVGNLIMGVLFGLFFARYKRVTPLVVAHTIIDIVAYVGYALFASQLAWLH